MLLITLEKTAVGCQVELDGIDISHRVRRIQFDADVASANGITEVVLTLFTAVTIVGEPGRMEITSGPEEAINATTDPDARRTGDGDQVPRTDSGDHDQR